VKRATDEMLTDAVVYESNIVQAKAGAGNVANINLLATSHTVQGGAAPAWFFPAMQQALGPTNARIDALSDRVNALSDRVDTLTDSVNEVARMSAVVSGPVVDPPHNPPINNIHTLGALTGRRPVALIGFLKLYALLMVLIPQLHRQVTLVFRVANQ